MSKQFKEEDRVSNTIYLAITIVIAIVFTLMGFFIKQPCDIDEQYLYCRLHPASFIQVVGVIGFYLTCFILSGAWGKWLTLWNKENSSKWNFIFFGIGAASFIMLWFG